MRNRYKMEQNTRNFVVVLLCTWFFGIAVAVTDIDPKDLLLYQGSSGLIHFAGVHGKPGVDFPTFSNIPKTTFNCKDVDSGYYADLETDCQVFHICNEGTKISFLCPNGTIFQQSDLICDWWFKVNCTSSPELYEESAEHLREESIKRKASRRVINNENNRRTFYTSEEEKPQIRKTNRNFRNNRISSDETQVPQETASFVRDPSFNRNNIRSSSKYPNHRTTYSDLKDPKYFTKNSVVSTTSSSIKPEIISKQKAPINNGRPFTATTVEGIYDSNGGITPPANKIHSSSTKNNRHNGVKKQTTVYVNTYKSPSKSSTKSFTTTRKYLATTTPSSIIRIALTNKQNALSVITGDRKGKESPVVNIVTLPPTTEITNVDITTNPSYDIRKSKAIKNNLKGNKIKTQSLENYETTPSTDTDKFYYLTNDAKATATPKYKVSSPRPFFSVTTETTSEAPTTLQPTQPTVTASYLNTVKNVNNMIATIMNLTENNREGKEYDKHRPDLVIPPSVGPQTLHTLAVYFANALDSLEPVTDENPTEKYDQTDDISLLSQTTVRQYNNLFKQRQEEIENAMVQMMENTADEDLVTENTKHAFETPNVRQLAKVFTEALSAYLDDPVGFKRDLEKVRPTDPPQKESYSHEDEEVLNFSDADIQNKERYLPVASTSPATPQTGWGYDENSINEEKLLQSNSKYYSYRQSKSRSTAAPDFKPSTTSNFVNLFNTHTPTRIATLIRNLQAPTAPTLTKDENSVRTTLPNNGFTNNFVQTTQSTRSDYGFTNDVGLDSTDNSKSTPYRTTNTVINSTPIPYKTTNDVIYSTNAPYRVENIEIESTGSPYETANTIIGSTGAPYRTTNTFDYSTNNYQQSTIGQSQTTFDLPKNTYEQYLPNTDSPSTVFTTPPPLETTTINYTPPVYKETTESAVERLFKYFEQKARTTLLSQSTNYPSSTTTTTTTQAPSTFITDSVRYTTQTIDPETQRNIYSDIAKLNNLANIATAPSLQQTYFPSTTNNRIGKELNKETTTTPIPETTTKTSEASTNVPPNHREFYSTPFDTFSTTTERNLHQTNPISTVQTTLPDVQTTTEHSDRIYFNAHVPPKEDIETRFASLVNKASSILSNLHNVRIQPTVNTEYVEDDIEKGTAATYAGNTANLPSNHWTTSSDATKLWQSTLFVNPETLNQNLNATEETIFDTSTRSLNEISDDDDDVSFEASVPTYSEIEYDLQALPKLELNSTQVHGVLINFINSTMKTDHQLEKFLKKLNTTEDDFLKKMKEIEKNPLTRRLILLLISECGKEIAEDSKREAKQLSESTTKEFEKLTNTTPASKIYQSLVPLPSGSEDQDARALDLLNSLYTIASQYGRK